MNSLERPLYDLLQTEPFFANFLLGAKIVLNDPKIKTAAASVQKGQIVFYFNTEYMERQTREAQAGVLKHEIFHVLLDHCGVRGGGYKNRMAKNYAMDCAINQHITHLPDKSIKLVDLEKLCKRKLAAFESWEYYYEAIKDEAKKQQSKSGGEEPHDHDKMEEGEGLYVDTSEGGVQAEQAMNRAAIKDAANKAIAASAGNVPDSLVGIIGQINKVAQLPWKQLLRNFVAKARHINTKPSRLKPHRRFELDQPGKKKLKKLVLGVCTDSSGSVSDESYAAFMTEISTIAKSTTMTYLVHADCVVQKVDKIKNGKAKGDVLKKRHGGGGTAYGPAILECTKFQCDAIIYFGDFDCADKPQNPGIPVLWVGVGDKPAPADFGSVLRLK